MQLIEYLCGQNWVQQFKNGALTSDNLIERVVILSNLDFGDKGPFGKLRNWDYTHEGRSVWQRRTDEWRRTGIY